MTVWWQHLTDCQTASKHNESLVTTPDRLPDCQQTQWQSGMATLVHGKGKRGRLTKKMERQCEEGHRVEGLSVEDMPDRNMKTQRSNVVPTWKDWRASATAFSINSSVIFRDGCSLKTEFMSAIFAALLRASAFVGQFCRGEMNTVWKTEHTTSQHIQWGGTEEDGHSYRTTRPLLVRN